MSLFLRNSPAVCAGSKAKAAGSESVNSRSFPSSLLQQSSVAQAGEGGFTHPCLAAGLSLRHHQAEEAEQFVWALQSSSPSLYCFTVPSCSCRNSLYGCESLAALNCSCVFWGLHKFPEQFQLGVVKETLKVLFLFLTF